MCVYMHVCVLKVVCAQIHDNTILFRYEHWCSNSRKRANCCMLFLTLLSLSHFLSLSLSLPLPLSPFLSTTIQKDNTYSKVIIYKVIPCGGKFSLVQNLPL